MNFLLSLISVLLLSSCADTNVFVNTNETVIVSVEDSDKYVVESQNPVEVERGSDALFKITFNENYAYKSSSSGEYNDGYLRVNNVQYSQTIKIYSMEIVTVGIDVTLDSHFKVTSDNPLKIEKGTNAIFELEFDDGYTFESSNFGEYYDNKLIVKSVETNLTILVATKLKGTIRIEVISNPQNGEIKINGESALEDYCSFNDVITVEAVASYGKKFVCWSVGDYITNAMPLSFERIYSFELTDDIVLYANYWDNDKNTIIYNGNGGLTNSGDDLIYYPNFKENYIRFNTIQGSNAFYRDGYVLDSWNTESDGSGERIGLGSRVKIPSEEEALTLYAIWIKETSFELFNFTQNSDLTYSVTNCSSSDDVIVVPTFYNNQKVTIIESNAFVDLSFTTLYLPPYISEIKDSAVVNCSNFTNFHFFDFLEKITDNFQTESKPSFLYINANTDPTYIGSYQSVFARKTDLLAESSDDKIIIIGNSNAYYSVDGSLLAEHFGMDALCLGVQDGVGIAWELAVVKHFGQYDRNNVVFCVEFGGAGYLTTFSYLKYIAAESNYDLLLAIDLNVLNFGEVFSAYSKYRELKSAATITPYSNPDYYCDNYGSAQINIEPYRDDDWSASDISVNFNYYSGGGFKWIEDYCVDLVNSKFYLSTCSFNRNSIPVDDRDYFYTTYQESMAIYTKYPVVSKLSDYAFPGSAFLNDNYHLLYPFAVERTNKLISDLNMYLS